MAPLVKTLKSQTGKSVCWLQWLCKPWSIQKINKHCINIEPWSRKEAWQDIQLVAITTSLYKNNKRQLNYLDEKLFFLEPCAQLKIEHTWPWSRTHSFLTQPPTVAWSCWWIVHCIFMEVTLGSFGYRGWKRHVGLIPGDWATQGLKSPTNKKTFRKNKDFRNSIVVNICSGSRSITNSKYKRLFNSWSNELWSRRKQVINIGFMSVL